MKPRPTSRFVRRRAATALLVLGALVVPLVAVAAGRDSGERRLAALVAAPSFARDVAPIVRAKCAGCHMDGGIAPFAFTTERDLASRAALVLRAVEERRMPPWPPGPRSPAYVGQAAKTLTSAQRDALVRWAKTQLVRPGAPRSGTPVGTPSRHATAALPGESTLELALPVRYTPKRVNDGTDDYRCFVLDPELDEDAFVTSARVSPDADAIVHHVILYRVLPSAIASAERLDRAEAGSGWTCFGTAGIDRPSGAGLGFLDDAGWIAAWAPGSTGGRLRAGTGISLPAGSKIVMQVHYNLLNGARPDRSEAILTTAPATARLEPVSTTLLPAPVELACAKGEQGPLCDRTAAQFDQVRKYGQDAGLIPTGLLLLCGKNAAQPPASATTTCDRRVAARTTIQAVMGHMHLLGASISVVLNPETPRAQTLLEILRWDFHWQSSYLLAKPVVAQAGDVLRVTCRHDVAKRPSLRPRPPARYVLWGEGTRDEMCLGVLQVTRG